MNTTVINAVFFTNGTASHKWRIDGIADRVNRLTDHAIYVTDWHSWNEHFPFGTNLVIFEHIASEKAVRMAQSVDAKVIMEADDAWIDSWSEERKNLGKFVGNDREEVIATLKAVNAMTVTNDTLKDNYRRFTDAPIHVLPNYIDFNWYGRDEIKIPRVTDEIRIGWFGSQGHLEDLQMVIPALNEVLDRYPKAKFVYCGFGGMSSDSLVTEAGWGEDVFKAIPRHRREYYMGIHEDHWPMKHRTLDLDIGICPLIGDYFNKCKTPIKWMEFSILGTPAVVSPTQYGQYVTDGVDALIAHTTEDWVEHLSKLIEDRSFARKLGVSAQEKVRKDWDLDDHWTKWIDTYQEILGV